MREVQYNPAYSRNREARQVLGAYAHRKISRGNPNDKAIALTFDDGPHPKWTPQLLALLKNYNVKVTFFVVGKMAERYPNLITAEQDAGHLLANHTYHHVNLKKLTDEEIRIEFLACSDVLEAITHKRPMFCRPPGGDYDSEVIEAAADVGLTTVLWTDDPKDYMKPDETTLKERILKRIGNGGIILLHDGIPQTYDILPIIIEDLRARGFRFVTVRELAQGLLMAERPHARG